MKTLKMWFTNGGIRIRSIISQLLRVVDYKTLYIIKLRHRPFIPWSNMQLIIFV